VVAGVGCGDRLYNSLPIRVAICTCKPTQLHIPEDARQDNRVTSVFKNASVATEPGPGQEALTPNQKTFKKEEQLRFEILDAHWTAGPDHPPA
jgi:hypothetical protein